MTPDVVVDVGNTAIKWGRCSAKAVDCVVRMPVGDPDAWEKELQRWHLNGPASLALAASNHPVGDRLVRWLRQRGDEVLVIDHFRQLPLNITVYHPQKVGLDRLLNAVAALNSPDRCRWPALIIDAGTAITVDRVDGGVFRGGAILPGLRLMAQAMHDHTAALPLVEFRDRPPTYPGRSTEQAMQIGIFHAVVGGIHSIVQRVIEELEEPAKPPAIFLTGGDGDFLLPDLRGQIDFWPEMTLEGLRLTALAQPT
jgi:type III pantothenate kinase